MPKSINFTLPSVSTWTFSGDVAMDDLLQWM
jgi:hypothetical protein